MLTNDFIYDIIKIYLKSLRLKVRRIEKKGRICMEKYSKKKSFWTLAGALLLVIASCLLLTYKFLEDRAHYEKWKDYDECGI